MICIPSFSTSSTNATINMKLDFGGIQGSWPNYYNVMGKTSIDRNHKEDTIISYTNTDLNDSHYGYHMINSIEQKVMKIISAGYHTIELSVEGLQEEEFVNIYGLTFLDMQNYNLDIKTKESL